MNNPTAIEQAHAVAVQLRGALCELSDNRERSAEDIRARAADLAQVTDGLCNELRQLIAPTETQD